MGCDPATSGVALMALIEIAGAWPLRVWVLVLYLMGLNFSNERIAKESRPRPEDAHSLALAARIHARSNILRSLSGASRRRAINSA